MWCIIIMDSASLTRLLQITIKPFSRVGLAEGYAQQFVLNYALYRHREASNRPHDPYAGLIGYHDQYSGRTEK